MRKIFFLSLRVSATHFGTLVRRSIWVWIPIALTSGALTTVTDALVADTQIQGTATMILGLMIAVLAELIIGVLVTVFVSMNLNDVLEELPSHASIRTLGEYIKPLTIEGLRSLAKMLMWSLLLILPGLYQMIKLAFVNYVVLFDPRYKQGQIDALEESSRATQGLKRYLVLIMISGFAIEMGADWLRKSFVDGVAITFVAAIVKLALDIYLQGSTFALYKLTQQPEELRAS